jgi:hypothetical protein
MVGYDGEGEPVHGARPSDLAVASIRLRRSSELRRRAGRERFALPSSSWAPVARANPQEALVHTRNLGFVAATFVNAVVAAREELASAIRSRGNHEQNFSLDALAAAGRPRLPSLLRTDVAYAV